MELRDLNYFLACVEHRSVTAAARAIHVAQPTLSHALARLEREAGVRLLDRRPRDDLRPTAAGRLLLARARDARAAIDGFAADLAALQGLARGELLVASIQSLNATLLPVPIARFVARYPGVALGVRTHPAEAIAQAVRHGREEIGFVAGAPPETLAGLSVRRLHQERFVAIIHKSDALARRRKIPMAALRDRALALVPAGRLYRDGGTQRLRAGRFRSAHRGHARFGRRTARDRARGKIDHDLARALFAEARRSPERGAADRSHADARCARASQSSAPRYARG